MAEVSAVCSRLSTAGSIAAALRRSLSPLASPCAPAFQRRAPLRQIHAPYISSIAARAPAFQRRAPLRPSGLPSRRPSGRRAPAFQRRAPLRQANWLIAQYGSVHVLPPFNGGLHCGASPTAGSRPEQERCSRLSTAGSIAAPTGKVSDSVPSPVLPPFNGGLHCGEVIGCEDVPGYEVLPPFNGGLHCGPPAHHQRSPAIPVLPPFNGGLHCGKLPLVMCPAATGECSRLSTAGSMVGCIAVPAPGGGRSARGIRTTRRTGSRGSAPPRSPRGRVHGCLPVPNSPRSRLALPRAGTPVTAKVMPAR